MMNYILILCLLLSFCTRNENPYKTNPFPDTSTGYLSYITQESFYSNILNQEWKYNVYYPAYYSTQKTYPIIYLLHGAYESYTDWQNMGKIQIILSKLILEKKIPPSIVIMPDGQNTWYTGKMLQAFEKELFSYIENNFPVHNTRQYRMIGGNSMGGYGALTIALRNPEYFKNVFALSPAITSLKKSPSPLLIALLEKDFSSIFGKQFAQEKWDAISYNHYYKDYKKQPHPLRFFIAVEKYDLITPAKNSIDLVNKLTTDRVEHEFLEIPTGSHSWGFWTIALESALTYFGTNTITSIE